jgi:Cd2+/Zn2+-exporting ATPase
MFAAAFGAAAIGHPEEGALLLVLFAFGGAGEAMAMDRARNAIEKLTKLAPETATMRDETGNERLVPVAALKPGDRILIRPFDRVSADGAVEEGESAIDQSPITGESVPIEKSPGESVFAGTINGQGLLVVRVTRTSAESTLSKIIRLVHEAQASKSPTQLFTDKVEKRYVPLVLIATALLIVVPPLVQGGNLSAWFYRAMAFLTAASPCALAIGTPAAVLCGIARAAQIGVLVKGGAHLETLGRVKTVALDKTGTLTRGRPEVTAIVPLDSVDESELLRLAASVEQVSTHPLAAAIVAEAKHREVRLPDATDVQQIAGKGIMGMVEGRRVEIGRLTSDRPSSQLAELLDAGNTVVQVTIDNRVAGAIALADRPRDNAIDALQRLQRIGVRRRIMLTGDNRNVANAIAAKLGVDEVHAELMPQDKLRIVIELREKYGSIAMIGDGVNDAPALAAADVGIAMGGAGTDVALETADVALMADDLGKLPDAIALSRFARRIITQNLAIALGVIAVLAPLSALGFTYLGVAVLFHEGSTVVVVLNSMRILLYGRRKRVR